MLEGAGDDSVARLLGIDRQRGVEAEATGLRRTGIGCFFDDAVHSMLGIADRTLQMLYGFTVGGSADDPRLVAEPAYFHLDRADSGRD